MQKGERMASYVKLEKIMTVSDSEHNIFNTLSQAALLDPLESTRAQAKESLYRRYQQINFIRGYKKRGCLFFDVKVGKRTYTLLVCEIPYLYRDQPATVRPFITIA